MDYLPRVSEPTQTPHTQKAPERKVTRADLAENNRELKKTIIEIENVINLQIASLVAMAKKDLDRGNDSGAKESWRKAKDIAEKFLSSHDFMFQTDSVAHALAGVYWSQGKHEEAVQLLENLDTQLVRLIGSTGEGEVKDWFQKRMHANLQYLAYGLTNLLAELPEDKKAESRKKLEDVMKRLNTNPGK